VLTGLQIEKLAPPEKRREIPDGKISGLYLVLQPSGARSWALRYRVSGAPKKLTLGAYPALTLGKARRAAQKALAEVVDGVDPSARKKAAREAAKAAREAEDRIEDVVATFVQSHLAKQTSPGWAKEAERLLRVEIVAKWGKRRLGEITPREVDKLLGEIAERPAPITANRTLAVFRKMCNWAAAPKVGLISASPCAGVEAPTQEHSRERVLSDEEVRLAWKAFDAIDWPFGPLAKLLLLTGMRRDEVASLRWSEVDLGARLIRLPGGRTKNGKPHHVPLSDTASAVIEGLPHVGRADFVFSTTGRSRVSGFSRAKSAIDKAIIATMRAEAEARGDDPGDIHPPAPWVIHDLRRTVATNLQRVGVKLEVTEAVLNHVSGSRAGIVGVYQRHEYAAEKRAALDAWSHRLEEIVTGRESGMHEALVSAEAVEQRRRARHAKRAS